MWDKLLHIPIFCAPCTMLLGSFDRSIIYSSYTCPLFQHLGAERVLHDTPQRSVHSYGSSIQMFHVIFALQGDKVSQFVVDSYHRLSHKLATAINHEERRQSYLNQNVKQITSLLDMHQGIDSPTMSPYETVLEKNALATLLKKVFDDIVRDGSTSIRVNDWVHVSFCLLPKIHRNPVMNDARLVEQIAKMRPYHGLLLLASEQEIFSELPIDASSALVRFVRIISPLSNFQLLAMEAGVTLKQVYAMAGHLIYWAKARLIFPVCETNVYALAPEASTKVMSEMCDEFSQRFNDLNLLELLADMSMPVPLRDLVNPFSENMDSGRITQIVIWCLRKNLLVQLHTYVYLIPGEVMDLNYLQNEGLNWVTLPHEVRLKVNLVPAAVNDYQTQDIQTLMKLVPYFRGNVHLEEMMFNVNIKRSHLMIVLDKFRDVLVIVVHEDPNLPAFL